MFACVTGLTTPGVRAQSAWYGPLDVEPVGLKYATASNSTAAATRSVRSDMLRRCGPRAARASCPSWTRPSRETVAGFDNMLTSDQKGNIAETAITAAAAKLG